VGRFFYLLNSWIGVEEIEDQFEFEDDSRTGGWLCRSEAPTLAQGRRRRGRQGAAPSEPGVSQPPADDA
jgi:hypothetical protein